LVPEHRILSETEKEALLEQYHISLFQLPLIKAKDPIVVNINAEEGDVIEIIREGPSGKYKYFRRVAS
jgi:DNA-directed RNA polymerase subunit H